MIARLLIWLLLAQAVLAAMVGAWAWQAGVVQSLAGAVLLGLATVLLLRLLITANNFYLSWRFGSPTPAEFALRPAQRLRLFLREFSSTLRHSSYSMVRGKARTRRFKRAGLPVLLIHGYACNSGYWVDLIAHLESAHVSYATLDLEPLGGDIDAYVPAVAAALQAIGPAIIVAHSMGGLVARAYLRAHGPAMVAKLITLGTPHQGTSLANVGPGRNAVQMRRHAGQASLWLQALAAQESRATRALITSIYSHHDNIIAPQDSSVLEGARMLAFGGIGHVALASEHCILDTLMCEIFDVDKLAISR